MIEIYEFHNDTIEVTPTETTDHLFITYKELDQFIKLKLIN